MQYGYFDDARREYVIERPDTPYPWINYLGSESFFSLFSQCSGGYSFYRDARLLRLTRYRYNNAPADMGGRYFYIRDGADVWSPQWLPMKSALDSFECRHGLGYSVISSSRGGLGFEQTVMVPQNADCEVHRVVLTNNTDAAKELTLTSYIEFCLWNAQDDMTNFQRNFSTGEVEIEDGVIYHKTEYRERRNHYAVWSVNARPFAYDTDRESFLGLYNGPESPQSVMRGEPACSVASGWSPVGAHWLRLRLEPGESRSFIFTLAYVENPPESKFSAPGVVNKAPAKALLARFNTDALFCDALAALRAYWDTLLTNYKLGQCPDEKLGRMVNIWNQYQCMVTFNMSRSASYFESGIGRGMGFRDSSQDLLGFVHLVPERARERILDIAATQFPDGSAYHQYQPLTKRGNADLGSGFNDDPLWLIYGAAAYIKETGDYSILDEQAPFLNDENNKASMMEHLTRSFFFTVNNLGPHGLPLIGRADWNDCLNLNCFSETPGESFQTTENKGSGSVAESLMIAGLFCFVAPDYIALAEKRGLIDEALRARKALRSIREAVETHGWDGRWFLRAYDAHGSKVGSSECAEGKIFIESNGFCVMAGIGLSDGKAVSALDAVREYLDTDYGIMLQQPAYSRYYLNLGEISSYPPGYKENAGIFCHNNPWICIAETKAGRGARAFEVYRRTCPAYLESKSEIHRTEPYVYAQMVAGRDAVRHGEAKNSWLTGTAAWSFLCVSQYILGLRPELEGLVIDPCLPPNWRGFSVTRRYRGAVYHITVDNSAGVEKGIKQLTVNGKPHDGPLNFSGGDVEVLAVMG